VEEKKLEHLNGLLAHSVMLEMMDVKSQLADHLHDQFLEWQGVWMVVMILQQF